MDWEEVMRLEKEMRALQERLENLRGARTNITQIIRDMPGAKNIDSRLEELTIKILETERLLDDVRSRLAEAKNFLTEKIFSEIEDARLQRLMYLRYVRCLSFRKIAKQMDYSLSHVFRLHDGFVREIGQ